MTRLFGYLSILAVLAACGYAFLGPERFGGLNPIGKASEAEAGAERASAKYTLAIVAGQLDQVHAPALGVIPFGVRARPAPQPRPQLTHVHPQNLQLEWR